MSRIILEPGPSGPVTRYVQATLIVETKGPGFVDLTDSIAGFVWDSGFKDSVLTALCRHTSASLTIQENADPDVREDLMTAFDRLAPRGARYVHDLEGPDDMPAHIRTLISGVDLTVPVRDGRLHLGTWQGIYLVEHRDRPHRRDVSLCLLG
jgi:secondary thiamine-phosphate synthase enzyme